MPEKTYRRNPDIVARRVGGETLLVPTGSSLADRQCLFTLNDTGTFLWGLLAAPRTFARLLAALVEAFEVKRARAERDLRRFLADLESQGCITGTGARTCRSLSEKNIVRRQSCRRSRPRRPRRGRSAPGSEGRRRT